MSQQGSVQAFVLRALGSPLSVWLCLCIRNCKGGGEVVSCSTSIYWTDGCRYTSTPNKRRVPITSSATDCEFRIVLMEPWVFSPQVSSSASLEWGFTWEASHSGISIFAETAGSDPMFYVSETRSLRQVLRVDQRTKFPSVLAVSNKHKTLAKMSLPHLCGSS